MKVYLIEMIRAKKYCTNEEVNAIVTRIKDERKQLTQTRKPMKRRKKRIQALSTSSTSNQSPPIGITPRRLSNATYPSFRQSVIKYQRPSILQPVINKRTIESDRVLRSFNNRLRNYRIVNINNSVYGVLKAQNRLEDNSQCQLSVAIQRPIGNCLVQRRPVNVQDECVQTEDLDSGVQRQRHVTLHHVNSDRQLVPVVRSSNIPQQKPTQQRRLSGIYPLPPPDRYSQLTSVGFRRQDGTIARINAIVQKPHERFTAVQRKPPVISIARNRTAPIVRLRRMPLKGQVGPNQAPKVSVQDIINYKIDQSNFSNSSTESARESSLEREAVPIHNVNKDLGYARQSIAFMSAGKSLAEKAKILSEFRNNAEYAKRRIENSNYATENANRSTVISNRSTVISNRNTEHPYRNTEIINHVPEYNTRRPERRVYIADNVDRNTESQNTTGVANRFLENRTHVIENINRNTENRNYDTENINRNTDNRNYMLDPENRTHATDNMNSNYDTGNINRNTLNRNYMPDPENRTHTTVNMNGNYDTENINRNTENRNFMPDPENRTHAAVNMNRNYATENINRNTEIRNYMPDPENRNMENRNYEAENGNRYTENRNYVIEYPTENENTNSAHVQSLGVNIERDYPNMSALTDVYPANQVFEVSSTEENDYSVYYHKKIRAEQMRTQRTCAHQTSTAESLPHITDVFSKFNDLHYRDLTQPLYVQVSEPETDIVYPGIINSSMLESIYTLKSDLLHQPLQPVPTTNNTKCTYSTPVITTAVAQPSAACDFNTHSYTRDNLQHNKESTPRVYDFTKTAELERRNFRCHEVLSRSSGSFDTNCSQELEVNVTIPEMVEDALELISQDGDYMERIELDIRMQCILCEWAGPKIIMEYHIRKEHPSDIVVSAGTEWSAVFTLGALLARDTWLSKPVLHNGNIYVLSAKYETDCLMATLTVLPTVSDEVLKFTSITVYNKVTGEPHTWQGDIAYLPDTMPYRADCNGLKLDISCLDLLPNSANLKLVNGELVINSSAKVVVGQPELNSVEIAVYVKIFG